MSQVSVRKVDIAFGSVPVLEQLDLEVAPGEFLVLLGPSGCGKSTLLNAIAGLLDVSRGQVWIGDRNVTWAEPKDRGIAMVFQSYALYPQMTVAQNMGFGLKIAGRPREEVDRRVREAAAMLQLTTLLGRKPAALSGGQRQRVAIGRALVRDVGVFLFDEPLSNLDAQLRNELRVEIKRLHQQLGTTMIYVTHDQIEALTLADRIAVMKDRTIQQLATPEEIYLRPANRFVAGFVGSPAMNFHAGAIEAGKSGPAFRRGELSLPLPDRFRDAGGAVELGIRPEHIVIGTGADALPAAVEMVEPMGAETLVWARVADEPFSLRVEHTVKLRPGDRIDLSFPGENVHVFRAGTGKRL
ncbi:MAG: sn-glycerol-3-phosphate ABC transporter ATP-binding protein UgpC [Rhizobiales bacterium]|nr:sn-glycerol-3-phosphate ABC transporter ATP-binding protein UgpC [Hyphomicrobiales bacterium]OJU35454.1 MAG: ABC transporter ATP-binding protein [Rhizobiales bacterium 68-8]